MEQDLPEDTKKDDEPSTPSSSSSIEVESEHEEHGDLLPVTPDNGGRAQKGEQKGEGDNASFHSTQAQWIYLASSLVALFIGVYVL